MLTYKKLRFTCLIGLNLIACGFVFGADKNIDIETTLKCEVTYQPTQQVWIREVKFISSKNNSKNKSKLLSILIDGIPVYTFIHQNFQISTSLDNERIQLHLSDRLWMSDFRGLAQGQGFCEPLLSK
jgi:hypothetical protein